LRAIAPRLRQDVGRHEPCFASAPYEKLRRLGLETGNQTSAKTVKTVMIKDPDGNSIAFAETIDAATSR
jgi:hypothetical protein